MADVNVSDWNLLVCSSCQAWKEFFLAKGQVVGAVRRRGTQMADG
jgi:hypothetical protein